MNELDSSTHREPEHGAVATTAHPSLRVYYLVFAALLALLVVTVVMAEVELGAFNFFVAAAIATLKAVLIMLFFMHVRYSLPLTWLVAGAGFFWLGILFVLTLSDYLTRGVIPY
jgi:cytochrome c oxidase subunit 4